MAEHSCLLLLALRCSNRYSAMTTSRGNRLATILTQPGQPSFTTRVAYE